MAAAIATWKGAPTKQQLKFARARTERQYAAAQAAESGQAVVDTVLDAVDDVVYAVADGAAAAKASAAAAVATEKRRPLGPRRLREKLQSLKKIDRKVNGSGGVLGGLSGSAKVGNFTDDGAEGV